MTMTRSVILLLRLSRFPHFYGIQTPSALLLPRLRDRRSRLLFLRGLLKKVREMLLPEGSRRESDCILLIEVQRTRDKLL